MGVLKSIFKAFSCESECSLNQEALKLKRFLKKLALEDMRDLIEYYEAREKHIVEKKKEFRKSINLKISQI